MTHPSVPSGSHGAEGDSEKKKWGYKREQFAAVINNTKLNGAIDRLAAGTLEVRALLKILDELNSSNQQGRYMAEMLALKQESRKIASIGFSPAVAEFLIEGSKRIPLLSDGLASQLAVTLASAADNHEYLDTVNTAVGRLLVNLDHPLKPDTRNYLRALTDKIDATRRLQQARSHLSTVPSVYPPASEKGVSPVAPPVAPVPPAPEPLPRFSDETLDSLSSERPPPQTPRAPEVIAPLVSATKTLILPAVADLPTPKTPAVTDISTPAPEAVVSAVSPPISVPVTSALHVEPIVELEPQREPPAEIAPPEPTARGLGKVAPTEALPVAPLASSAEEPLQIPTKPLPWKLGLVLLGAVTVLTVGAYAYLRTTSDGTVAAPSASVSASAAPSVSASAADERAKSRRAKRHAKDSTLAQAGASSPPPASPKTTESPAKTAKNATLDEVRAMEKTPALPAEPKPVATKPVEPKPVATKPVEPKPVATKPVEPKPVATKPVEPKPVASKPVEPAPEPTTVPRTPPAVKDIDQLFTEMRQVPNDVGRIEAVAHEVSRIVARSVKPEADKILSRMTPEELLFGMESYDTRALEPLRRVVALTLQKVAVDKDDARAALAIEMLGEWAKSRKHGGAAKLTLEQLAEEPVVLSRPKRRQALDRVLSRLGISADSTEST